jgi:hypothetical protein
VPHAWNEHGDGPEAAPSLVSIAPVASLRTFGSLCTIRTLGPLRTVWTLGPLGPIRTFRALRTFTTFTTVAPFTARGVLANARAFAQDSAVCRDSLLGANSRAAAVGVHNLSPCSLAPLSGYWMHGYLSSLAGAGAVFGPRPDITVFDLDPMTVLCPLMVFADATRLIVVDAPIATVFQAIRPNVIRHSIEMVARLRDRHTPSQATSRQGDCGRRDESSKLLVGVMSYSVHCIHCCSPLG